MADQAHAQPVVQTSQQFAQQRGFTDPHIAADNTETALIENCQLRPVERGTVLVTQRAHVVERRYKAAALGRVLDIEVPGAALVFCRTRGEALIRSPARQQLAAGRAVLRAAYPATHP